MAARPVDADAQSAAAAQRRPLAPRAPLEDWSGIGEQLARGDRLAILRVARLVSAVLGQLRAYDFEDEWDDLRQEVLTAVFANARRGSLRDPKAFVGYVRIITRNKFVDRLKRRERHRERDTQAWQDESGLIAAEPPDPQDAALWEEVARLPEPGRSIVEGIYLEGHTYPEMSERSGIPLGTLKRKLTEALRQLRQRLGPPSGSGSAPVTDLGK